MDKIAGFSLAVSEIIDRPTDDTKHPFVTIARFVFADDKPNGNKQAVPYEEFGNIMRTAIGMPVKMYFDGFQAGDHPNAVPIGVIQKIDELTLDDGTHQLIAEAALWDQEYPDEIMYLKNAFASGKGPGLSYEMRYREPTMDNGIEWLRNIITSAITFVRRPAYGSRTHLLALSSISDDTKRNQEIVELAASIIKNKPNNKGGNQMDEKELEKLKETHATALASKQTEIEGLTAKVGDLEKSVGEKDKEITDLKLAGIVTDRMRKYTEAGFTLDAEASKNKENLFKSFSDEQFTAYLADLVALKPAPAPQTPAQAALAKASLNTPAVPKLEFEETDMASLKDVARSLARPHSA